jgi:hypothetical protein
MRTALVICLALAQAATAQISARAEDSYGAVNAMRLAFSQVHSVLATERFSNGDVATVEYNFPDRFHITTARAQIILSGDMEYVKPASGRWVSSRNGAEHQALLAAAWQLGGPPNIDLRNLYTIVPLGTKAIGTTLVRGFQLHDASGGNDETVWIGPDNLPVAARIEMASETIEIHYTGYNTSVRVATPL